MTGTAELVWAVRFWPDRLFGIPVPHITRVYIHAACVHDRLAAVLVYHGIWQQLQQKWPRGVPHYPPVLKKWAPRRLLLMPVWNSCLRDVMYQIKPFSQYTCRFHVESETVTETTKQWQWSTKVLREPIQTTEKWEGEKNFLHFAWISSALHINVHKHTHT